MKKLPALILFIITFTSSYLLFPKAVLAKVLFHDDFDDGNAEGWIVADNSCTTAQWQVKDGMYGIKIYNPGGCATNVIPDDSLWNESWNDYIFEVDMKFVSGTDHNLAFRYTYPNTWYGLHFIVSPLSYLSNVILERVSGPDPYVYYPFSNDNTYHIEVEVNGEHVKIFIDNKLVLDWPDAGGSKPTGRIALRAGVGADPISETWFDNVVVRSLEEGLEEEKEPLILLPGLGGSWNHQEIFLGIDQPQNAWYKTPFVESYNGLIQTLQNAGYTLNENLFIFYYDWLQSIDQSAVDLKNYVNTVVDPPSETKINLIGHSLGGLVGRAYIQNNPNSHKTNKLITLGSPHKGVPQVYYAWEGADLHRLLGSRERIGAGILLRLRGFGYANLVQAIRNLVPSLGNLLFIEDYLKWSNGGIIKPESSMFQQNTWLKELGVSSELLGLANAVVGTFGDTPRWLKIVERNQVDEKLGKWEDGKPVAEEAAIGDRTVLEESAELTGANTVTLAGLNHGDLVESSAGQEKILELLGVSDGVEITEQPEIPFEPALVFTVASPVTLRVTDPLGRQIGAGVDLPEIPYATFSAQEKIIIIPQAIDGEYKVEIISEHGGGSYQLLIGQLTQERDIWSMHQDAVGGGETDTYTIPNDNTFTTTDTYLANLINTKLKNLLRQIRRQNIELRVKIRLSGKVLRILGRTKPLPLLLKLERDKQTARYTQKTILKTTEAINYAEKFNLGSLPHLREILDLLGQLHQLLES